MQHLYLAWQERFMIPEKKFRNKIKGCLYLEYFYTLNFVLLNSKRLTWGKKRLSSCDFYVLTSYQCLNQFPFWNCLSFFSSRLSFQHWYTSGTVDIIVRLYYVVHQLLTFLLILKFISQLLPPIIWFLRWFLYREFIKGTYFHPFHSICSHLNNVRLDRKWMIVVMGGETFKTNRPEQW